MRARGGASRAHGSGRGDRPARRRRETVAWKLGRRRSLEKTAAMGRARPRRTGGDAAWSRGAAVAPEAGSRPSVGGRRGVCGRETASGTPRRCRPPEGAAERSGLTRNREGSGPSQDLALLTLHPKTPNCASVTKLPPDRSLSAPWGSLFPNPTPALVHVPVIGEFFPRVASSYTLRTECISLTKPCRGRGEQTEWRRPLVSALERQRQTAVCEF